MTLPNTNATVPLIPQGQSLNAQACMRTFNVSEVRAQGRNPETGKERFWIKVKFSNGQVGAFRTESKNLKTAFEMIEFIGQQTRDTNGDNGAKYSEFLRKNKGKRLWVHMANISKNPNFKMDEVIAFKRDRHGNSLKYLFSPHKGFQPMLTIRNDVLAELKQLAKLQQDRLDQSASLNPNNPITVDLNKVNN